MRRSLKGPMREIGMPVLLAAAGGAGLAAGFNTPLVAILFSAEDLLKRFNLPLVWSSLPVALLASLVAAYGGQPTFAYGELPMLVEGPMQMLLALPVGVACGLIGALFSICCSPSPARWRPWRFVTHCPWACFWAWGWC